MSLRNSFQKESWEQKACHVKLDDKSIKSEGIIVANRGLDLRDDLIVCPVFLHN